MMELTRQRLDDYNDHTLDEGGERYKRAFLARLFEDGPKQAFREASKTVKEASLYGRQQKEAQEKIQKWAQSSSARGFFDFLHKAHTLREEGGDVTKIAQFICSSSPKDDYDKGCLKAAERVLNSCIEKVAWQGPS